MSQIAFDSERERILCRGAVPYKMNPKVVGPDAVQFSICGALDARAMSWLFGTMVVVYALGQLVSIWTLASRPTVAEVVRCSIFMLGSGVTFPWVWSTFRRYWKEMSTCHTIGLDATSRKLHLIVEQYGHGRLAEQAMEASEFVIEICKARVLESERQYYAAVISHDKTKFVLCCLESPQAASDYARAALPSTFNTSIKEWNGELSLRARRGLR